jgi:hypothetical protein
MNYLFLSEDCLNCSIVLKVLGDKDKEKWTRCLTVVYVKSNSEGKLETYMNDQLVGDSPISKVPALYLRERDELIVGGYEVLQELSNVNWFC